MNNIKIIDLWTEQHDNHYECFIFYKDAIPIRLVVINKDTDIDKCINIALEQHFENSILKDYYVKHNIKSAIIDMKEEPICKVTDNIKVETDVGSCYRWKLLYNMLKGSYTESDTSYGNFESDRYEFMPNLFIKYELNTDTEKFEIEHKCAFINTLKTRLIPIQENSPLTR